MIMLLILLNSDVEQQGFPSLKKLSEKSTYISEAILSTFPSKFYCFPKVPKTLIHVYEIIITGDFLDMEIHNEFAQFLTMNDSFVEKLFLINIHLLTFSRSLCDFLLRLACTGHGHALALSVLSSAFSTSPAIHVSHMWNIIISIVQYYSQSYNTRKKETSYKGASEIKYIYTLINTWTPPLIKAFILRCASAIPSYYCLMAIYLCIVEDTSFTWCNSILCMALTLKSLNFGREGKSIVYLHETNHSSTIFCWTLIQSISTTGILLAWENSRHWATLTMVSPPNDVWETRAEIPYWWCITTQIWVSFGGETNDW